MPDDDDRDYSLPTHAAWSAFLARWHRAARILASNIAPPGSGLTPPQYAAVTLVTALYELSDRIKAPASAQAIPLMIIEAWHDCQGGHLTPLFEPAGPHQRQSNPRNSIARLRAYAVHTVNVLRATRATLGAAAERVAKAMRWIDTDKNAKALFGQAPAAATILDWRKSIREDKKLASNVSRYYAVLATRDAGKGLTEQKERLLAIMSSPAEFLR